MASATLAQTPRRQPYLVTAAPLTELCIAVDPTPPARAWWWQSFTATCATRATGPGLFEVSDTRIQIDGRTAAVRLQFRLPLQAPSGGDHFRDVEVVFANDTVLDVKTQNRAPLLRRDDLAIPELTPRGQRWP